MKKCVAFVYSIILFLFLNNLAAQRLKGADVPAPVRTALVAKYPHAKKVTWEKEDGNYEANWGGKTGEANSVQFTPSGNFIEIVEAMPVNNLPAKIITYIQEHYKGAKITEAGRVTDAQGKKWYEAEVNKKDILFNDQGKFVRSE